MMAGWRMSSSKVRVALLGAGFMGRTHAKAWASIDGCEIAVIVARSGERARTLAQEVGARWTTDPQSALCDDKITAVDITYPTFLHGQYAVDALQAGKHVIVEKPIAMSLADAEEMARSAAQSGRIFMVAHVLEFWPEYAHVRDMTRKGVWGRPLALEATRLSAPPGWSTWLKDPELSGGVIVDLSVHDFEYANTLLGAPSGVWTCGVESPAPSYDHHTTVIKYGSAMASITGSERMPDGFPFTSSFRLLLEDAVVEYSFRAAATGVESGQARNLLQIWEKGTACQVVDVPQHDPFKAELEYFKQCVQSGSPNEFGTSADAIGALRVALAGAQSMRTGAGVSC